MSAVFALTRQAMLDRLRDDPDDYNKAFDNGVRAAVAVFDAAHAEPAKEAREELRKLRSENRRLRQENLELRGTLAWRPR